MLPINKCTFFFFFFFRFCTLNESVEDGGLWKRKRTQERKSKMTKAIEQKTDNANANLHWLLIISMFSEKWMMLEGTELPIIRYLKVLPHSLKLHLTREKSDLPSVVLSGIFCFLSLSCYLMSSLIYTPQWKWNENRYTHMGDIHNYRYTHYLRHYHRYKSIYFSYYKMFYIYFQYSLIQSNISTC